ncbi:MAG: potassium transporter [Marinilabiliales bacterium]|nr:MAG: potassium transporter [Marinilabiliales bacterium]
MITGRILSMLSICLLSCVFIAIYFKESITPFFYSIAICLPIAAILLYISRKNKIKQVRLKIKDSFFIVSMSWILIGIIGALPYLFSHNNISLTDSLFESISGFTTTGSSILTDIEALPKSLLFWRSLTHWIGGIGIIVLVLMVLPEMQLGGYKIFNRESSLQERITPKAKSAGFRVFLIYLGLTIAEIIFLLFGKMSLFDSVCHSFATVATGGFSPKNTSITDYSPYIQYVIMVFMILAGTNFTVHYILLHGKFKKAFKNEELKLYLLIILILGGIVTAGLYLKAHLPFEQAFREAYFQLISIITCTGFATADYLQWPQYLWILIFFAMFIGGSTGSTAGGIKVSRHLIILKNINRRFKQMLYPKAIIMVRYNNKSLGENENSKVMTFVSLYFIVFTISTVLLVFTGMDIQ